MTLSPGSSRVEEVGAPPMTVELFRGTEILSVVPFSSTDNPAELDSALPDASHGVADTSRPSTLDAAFTFPLKTDYADNASANGAVDVFRLRLKNVADGFDGQQVQVTIKLLTRSGQPVGLTAFGNGTQPKGASHSDGMQVILRKRSDSRVWESPYMRVATTPTTDPNRAVVHSLWPLDNPMTYPADPTAPDDCRAVMDAGKQFGRRLQISGTVNGTALVQEFPLGGMPYARIPVKITLVTDDQRAPTNKQKRIARTKIHQLNAYWAGQGLEFELVDSAAPLETCLPPPRSMLTIGEFTGAQLVSDVAFKLTVSLSITPVGGSPQTETVVLDVPPDRTPSLLAAGIEHAIAQWRPAAAALQGLALTCTTFDISTPRMLQSIPNPPLASPGVPATVPLKRLGSRGPVDVVIVPKASSSVAIADLSITRIEATQMPGNAAALVDICAPPMKHPYHEAVLNPPSATTRQWVRTFASSNRSYVSVVVESQSFEHLQNGKGYPHILCENGLCALYDANVSTMKSRFDALLNDTLRPDTDKIPESKSDAVTLLNFGLWSDPSAGLMLFLREGIFAAGRNDVQHEMGHALADRDHTINDPEWFYGSELMRYGGPKNEKALKMTRHKVFAGYLVNSGGWKGSYEAANNGYGGAVRARIQRDVPGWLVSGLASGQLPW